MLLNQTLPKGTSIVVFLFFKPMQCPNLFCYLLLKSENFYIILHGFTKEKLHVTLKVFFCLFYPSTYLRLINLPLNKMVFYFYIYKPNFHFKICWLVHNAITLINKYIQLWSNKVYVSPPCGHVVTLHLILYT